MSYTIYSKPACSQCDQAKILLKMKGLDFTFKMLGTDYEIEEIKDLIPPTVKTFPIIFKDNEFFGGLVELRKELA